MTTVADVERVLDRCRRLRDGIHARRGTRASWEFTFPDGITERYTIRGQQPTEDLEDDVAHLFVWAWNTKDYLKELVRARGQDPQRIENLVNRTPSLCLLADVANRLKHSESGRRSRSNAARQLGRPVYSIDSRKIKSLEISAEGVVIEPATPEAVEISYPILGQAGGPAADAIVLLDAALAYWEQELAALQ
jgi:hypothetical protein